MKQASAWGQFWFDLSDQHRVHGCAIFTPRCTHIPHPAYRGAYYSTWYRMTDKGPIYYAVNGHNLIEMLRDGLIQAGCWNVRMRLSLLAVAFEMIEFEMEKRL